MCIGGGCAQSLCHSLRPLLPPHRPCATAAPNCTTAALTCTAAVPSPVPPPRTAPALPQVLAAFLKAIGFIIPLMDAMYANYYTREVMIILIRCA